MSISELSIKRPVFAWMLMAGLVLFGAISFKRMGISQMPNVDFPIININLSLDNASPELMEFNVVDIIEDAVMGIEGLQKVTSSVSQGIANITCQFEINHNVNTALQEVEDRIQQSSNLLPSLLDPPIITKTNPEDQPILWVLLNAENSVPLHEQMIFARNYLKNKLSMISGVGNILFAGYVDPNLRIWVDRKKLYQYNLTSLDITNTITAEQIEQPAGRIESSTHETNIRVLGEEKTPEKFGKIKINTRNAQPNFNPIALSKIATIQEGVADIRQISRFNGKIAVGLGIIKQHGSNAVEVAKRIHKKIAALQSTLPLSYHVGVHLDSTHFIQDSVNELNASLFFAVILTSIVCYLFLGSWSSTLNVLLSIPTSIVGSFTLLYFLGFTLNTFTLLGLSLAIGIVVDDAIMMLENIVRHYDLGKTRLQAAITGSNEITFAAIATTLAIIAIFIPVIFMKGVIGRFFYQYGITVAVAVLLSLLEAITLTPMRCSQFLHSTKDGNQTWLQKKTDGMMEVLSKQYRRSLIFCLKNKRLIISLSLVFFCSSIFLIFFIRKELIPAQDQSHFLLSLKTPVGSSIQVTDEAYKKVEAYLSKIPEIKDLYTTIGNYQNNNIVNAGSIHLFLKNPKERTANQREIMDREKKNLKVLFPDLEISTQDLSLSGLSTSRGFPIEFTLEGPEWEKLHSYSEALFEKIKKLKILEDINSDFQMGMPEIQITPNRLMAGNRGVSISTIASEIRNLIGGQKFNANTQYPKSGHRYDIRIRSEPNSTMHIEDIKNLLLSNNRGTAGSLVRLSEVATLTLTKAPQLISRVNRSRAISVYANIKKGESQENALKSVIQAGREVLPKNSGYHLKITGTAEIFKETFEGLLFALILGIAISYMVLASQFNSFIHPITVLMALPFSLSGALSALFLTHQSLSLFSMIGLILLMGIVKKNSILLVDFTNQRRAEGLPPNEALLEACPIRLRPILMTSVATIVGAIPAALNFGPGAETRIPMAISIIGGVLVSTILTLFVVPCVYSLLTYLERPEKADA